GRKEVFSCRGIRECVNFFRSRGHTDIIVFVPHFRREAARSDCPITDQHILFELEAENVLVWTPSRRINGRRIVCHDDRYILKTAEEKDAVIVSNDEYRDLIKENPRYRKLVNERLLMYSFVDGRYYHPERPNGVRVTATDRLFKEKQQDPFATARSATVPSSGRASHAAVVRTHSLIIPNSEKTKLSDEKKMVKTILSTHREEQTQQTAAPLLSVLTSARTDCSTHPNLDRHYSAPPNRFPPTTINHQPGLLSAPIPGYDNAAVHSTLPYGSVSEASPCLPFSYCTMPPFFGLYLNQAPSQISSLPSSLSAPFFRR
ncbi:unnamed protein product, partial [Gongylonema pulchrum]|uniref:RNase_Zc3h12a domain-containing protein n=1 Tax=Gongylonema pulchrum TaxID=637853 RepID=A0A183D136_9BILA